MQHIKDIIIKQVENGNNDKDIYIENGDENLFIEYIGTGPAGSDAMGVTFIKDDKACPVILMEILGDKEYPYYYRNDHTGLEHFVYTIDGKGDIVNVDHDTRETIHRILKEMDKKIGKKKYIEAMV
jgi:hypothetical protein